MSITLSILALIGYIIKITIDYAKVKHNQEEIQNNQTELKTKQSELKSNIDLIEATTLSEFPVLKEKITQLEKEFNKETEKNSRNFKDLFDSRTETQSALTELTTTVKILVQNMDKQFQSIETKLDGIHEKIHSKM